jgi:hypothetical protein
MQLGLDPEYLIEACTALTGDTIVFQFRSCEYGVSIHDGAPELRYQLVMPIDFGDRPVEPKEPESGVKEEVWNGKTAPGIKSRMKPRRWRRPSTTRLSRSTSRISRPTKSNSPGGA